MGTAADVEQVRSARPDAPSVHQLGADPMLRRISWLGHCEPTWNTPADRDAEALREFEHRRDGRRLAAELA